MTTCGHVKPVIWQERQKYPNEPKQENRLIKKGWRNKIIERRKNGK